MLQTIEISLKEQKRNYLDKHKIMFFLTEPEYKVFSIIEKKLHTLHHDNGFVYNRPIFFKTLLLNLDQSEIINTVFKDYKNNIKNVILYGGKNA